MTSPVTVSEEVAAAVENEENRRRGDWGWLLALLPAFPLLLLVLRVWYLARQDLTTVLLVLQSANPLGLVAALLISSLWALPGVVLLLRVLYLLLVVSDVPSRRTWLARAGMRTPTWVSVPAVVLAALSWQLRFLPGLLLLVLLILALEVRRRFGPKAFVTAATGAAVPIAAAVLVVVWVAPAVRSALFSAGEPATALLLLLPPLAAPFLTGPIPVRVARWLLPGLATALALVAPLLLGNSYLRAPVLPRVAIQYSATRGTAQVQLVQRGSLVAVDDRFTTVIDAGGQVHFLAGTRITDQVLCSTGRPPPTSAVSVHGWPVEQSVLSWAAPSPRQVEADPRCRGS
jgi:hypothetical protein